MPGAAATTRRGCSFSRAMRDVRGVLSDTSMWRGPERAEEAAVLTRAVLNQNLEGRTVPEDEDRAGIL